MHIYLGVLSNLNKDWLVDRLTCILRTSYLATDKAEGFEVWSRLEDRSDVWRHFMIHDKFQKIHGFNMDMVHVTFSSKLLVQ